MNVFKNVRSEASPGLFPFTDHLEMQLKVPTAQCSCFKVTEPIYEGKSYMLYQKQC